MIRIVDKRKCVGCNGCASVCPTMCIELRADSEGFSYPVVDVEKCIECGLCERVCPVLHQDEVRDPLSTYAAVNRDDLIRSKSSSGGLFTLLAESIFRDGGVVFGALFNENWEVVHSVAHNSEELAPMRGSKYVQSQIGECYKEAKRYLKNSRKVLFTGTPCQIAGLRRYLQREYENLTCVDIICHGVPSPAVFKAYIDEEARGLGVGVDSLRSFLFRDKKEGWRDSSVTRSYATSSGAKDVSEKGYKSAYMRGFLKDIYLRPSCYACPSKEFKSGSDITIADLWGVEKILPELDDDKGVSLVLVNSEKGVTLFSSISSKMKYKEIEAEDALRYNSSAINSVKEPVKREEFFDLFGGLSVSLIIKRLTARSMMTKIKRRITKLITAVKSTIKDNE